jgi:hypothetical protein
VFKRPEQEIVALLEYTESTYPGTRYAHVNADFCPVNPPYDASDRWSLDIGGGRDGWPYPVPYTRRLRVHCQTDQNSAEKRTVYADRLEYTDVEIHDSDAAEAIRRTLKLSEKYLAKVREEDGDPATYGVLVVRICKALGVKRMAIRNPSSWTSGYYQYLTLAQGREWIESKLTEFWYQCREREREVQEQQEARERNAKVAEEVAA